METLNRKNGEALGNNPNRLSGVVNLPEVERGRPLGPPASTTIQSGPLKRIQERRNKLDEQKLRLDSAENVVKILNRYGEKERAEILGIVEEAFQQEITCDEIEEFREKGFSSANVVEEKKSWYKFW